MSDKPVRGYLKHIESSWCKGCGNFGIIEGIRRALNGLNIPADEVCIVSGIGCSGYSPHYLGDVNTFHGIHGRTLPVATAMKLVNHELTVIAEGGDGDGFSEGGNHLLHAIRRNSNITYIVHDNRIFSLTKAQPSPTTDLGFPTKFTAMYDDGGQPLPSFNPIALSLAMGGTFVARSFPGDMNHLSEVIMKGIKHDGFALIDILQPCVAWNNKNTWKWYRDRIYKLEEDESYDPTNPMMAWERSLEWEKRVPIGIFYQNEDLRPAYEKLVPATRSGIPLVHKPVKVPDSILQIIQEFRV